MSIFSFTPKINVYLEIGDHIERDDVVANIETDKITLPVNAPESGVILEMYAQEGDTVTVGSELFKMDIAEQNKDNAEETPEEAPEEAPVKEAPKDVPAKEIVNETPAPAKNPAFNSAQPAPINASTSSSARSETRKKMTPMRAKIASRLKESQNAAASLTTFNEIDMSTLIELRSLYKDDVLKKYNVKFGFMSPFVFAAARALKELPLVNSRIEGNEIIEPSYVDISVAVATPKGLVTPVLRDCHLMTSFVEIEGRLQKLAEKAKTNAITQEDLAGGTFTISNGGIFGSLSGTPIINTPQSAILGMHAIKERPVAINGQVFEIYI